MPSNESLVRPYLTKPWHWVVANGIYLVAVCASMLLTKQGHELAPQVYELVGIILLVTVARRFTTKLRIWNTQVMAVVRETAQLQIQVQREMSAAALGILRSMTDVVFELDHNHVFVGDAIGLSALLLHGCSRSLAGKSIFDMVAEEDDAQQLRLCLCNATNAQDLSAIGAMYPLRLRDGTGACVHIQMLCVKFKVLEAQHYLCGTQELVDTPGLAHS